MTNTDLELKKSFTELRNEFLAEIYDENGKNIIPQ